MKKNTKTALKVLTLFVCAILLVAISVFATFAYLTSQDSVKNTFTIGTVSITLDESPVDSYGAIQAGDRVKANSYKLIPGHTYSKDPVVHFGAGSEASYLFIEVENGIAAIEDTTNTIDYQILENGWTALEGEAGVYYMSVAENADSSAVDYDTFDEFIVSGSADVSAYGDAEINITAYAIQADGFATAAEAWAQF